MLHIDGSYGEGGGQILRTSLSLAAITGEPIRIDRIRAGRQKPGLAAQHLTAVRAAAAICQAQVRGDALGSMTLEFIPGGSAEAGRYTFDVSEARQGGSAGTVTLVLQTILLPLALATGDSEVTLRGGTQVIHSPPFTFIEQVYLPMLNRMGVQAEARLRAWGWYPQGGGEVELRVSGGSQLSGLNLLERGNLRQVRGLAVVTELESRVRQSPPDAVLVVIAGNAPRTPSFASTIATATAKLAAQAKPAQRVASPATKPSPTRNCAQTDSRAMKAGAGKP